MEAKETKERMLIVHEAPTGEKTSSTVEKRTFKLKRIQREKRKLRKSMEVFLAQQGDHEAQTSPPPDVVQNVNVHATAFLKNLEQQDSAANKVLEEIDSSVDQTLQSIDTMMYTTKVSSQLVNSDSEGTSSSMSPRDSMKFNTFPKQRGP
ncbi:hypothetical protein FSP39_013305 [Pinctada imbricata]|uniref:Uncharacterized protein n=1 Tax=Pinctada imbricata TaxID=66713 RepID=A0AA88XYT9_PINIB|nr:hypothetical protein FSP39_013305 [Pinctada imbricata]